MKSQETEGIAVVLIVDDDDSKRFTLRAALASLDVEIVEADSGETALRRVMERDFAAILLDVRMPGMNGFETAALIRRRQESELTPIIFITAYASDEIVPESRYVEGAVDFMFAPVVPEVLRAKVSVFINLHKQSALLATQVRQVQASVDHLRSLTDSAPIGIFRTDSDDHFVYTNPRWTEITGFSGEEAFGKDWAGLLSSLEPPGGALEAGALDEHERVAPESRFEIPIRGGESRIVTVTSEEIRNGSGELEGWVGTLADVTAGVRAEKEGSRFRSLVQNSRDVIMVMDGDGICTYVSPGVAAVCGFAAKELIAVPVSRLIHEDDRATFDSHLGAIAGVEQSMEVVEIRAVTKAGESVWIEIRASDRLADPSIDGIVLNFHDISERRESAQQLAKSEKLLAEGQAASHLGSYDWNMGTGELTWSDEQYRLLGLVPQSVEASFELLLDRIHPDDRDAVLAGTRASSEEGVPFSLDFRVFATDGTVHWIQGKGEVMSENGSDAHLVGMSHDITDRKTSDANRMSMERELLKSERLFRMAFDAAQTGIALTHADGFTYADVNPALCEMLGYSRDELLKLDWKQITHPDDLERNLAEFAELQAGGADVGHLEKRYVCKNGETISVEITDSVIREPDGSSIYFVTHINNVTERALAREEKSRLEGELVQSQKMEAVGQLAGGIAHDFNNILSVILNYTEFATEGLLPGDERLADLREISKAGEKAARLVHQLLAFSRKEVVETRVINLNEVVTGMYEMLNRALGEDVDLRFEALPALPLVEADPGRIEQVLLNLALNARDSMVAGGVLEISTSLETITEASSSTCDPGDYVRITITDTGTGMSSETMKRIFEPFFTTKARGEGTGMGLSSAYGIVEQAGGCLSVESELGVGSRFSIHLPCTEAAPAKAREQQGPGAVGGGETILLVEDEDAVREMVARILTKSGYKVIPYSNGSEALDYCSTNVDGIDLLLTDVVMPWMSGKELSEKATAICGGLQTLFMSGYTDALIAQRGVMASGQNLITKPFKPEGLLLSVRSVLDKNGANV